MNFFLPPPFFFIAKFGFILMLQRQTQDISLLRIFQLINIALHPYHCISLYSVCVCVCVCVCVYIFHIVMLEPLLMSTLYVLAFC